MLAWATCCFIIICTKLFSWNPCIINGYESVGGNSHQKNMFSIPVNKNNICYEKLHCLLVLFFTCQGIIKNFRWTIRRNIDAQKLKRSQELACKKKLGTAQLVWEPRKKRFVQFNFFVISFLFGVRKEATQTHEKSLERSGCSLLSTTGLSRVAQISEKI